MIARGGSSSDAFVPTSTVCSVPARSTSKRDLLTRLHVRHDPAQVLRVRNVVAVGTDDHVVGLEDAVGGRADVDGADHDAVGRHLVAELAERDRRRDPLRRAHLREALLPLDPLGKVLGVVDVGRDDGGAFVNAREVALEQARLPDDHVHHVDAARPLVLVLALDVDERLDRARGVGQEDVVVGRVEGEDRDRDREHPDDRGNC